MHYSARRLLPLLAGATLLQAGCTQPTRPVAYTRLESASLLRPNEDAKHGHEPLTYQADVDWRRYRNVIVDPVVIYRGDDAQFVKVTEQEKETLAQYMTQQFREKLGQRFTEVDAPSDATLRVHLTLTGAKRSTMVLSTFTKMDMGGMPINAYKAMTGGEGLFMGSVSYAVEIYDARSGRLLKSYVDKQYPNAMSYKASFGSLTASRKGIDLGADSLMASFGPSPSMRSAD